MPRRPPALAAAFLVVLALLLPAAPTVAQEEIDWQHGIAMLGDLRYGPDAASFDYANPDAPKGGTLHMAAAGAFDSLNPFIVLGRTGAGVRQYSFASLMARSWDEPFSMYGYVAEAVATADDRSWVAFRLDPEAAFHDGTPITVDDVIFSFETLRAEGLPGFRFNYDKVERVERLGEDGIRFWFGPEGDWESPMILSLMPILSEAHYAEHAFDEPSLDVPLGSGPYRLATVDPGRRLAYERVEDWWAADRLAFNGQYNFDRILIDYYRDDDVALEAFAAGEYTFRLETSAENWATSYDFPAVSGGSVTLLDMDHGRPTGLRGFVFNTRRAVFADRRTRQALGLAFDFEWANENVLNGLYERITSLFDNSDLAPSGTPQGHELEILEPFRDELPAEVFEGVYEPPTTADPGGFRAKLGEAIGLLQEAGWEVGNGGVVDAETGQPLAFEILISSENDQAIALAYQDNLRRIGVDAAVRRVDSAEYQARLNTFDFDMIVHRWGVTLSPGTEQHLYWASENADVEGSRNYAGIREPAIDAAIEALVAARDRDQLEAAAHALDRLLMWGYYVVPLEYDPEDHVAFWGGYAHVEDPIPVYGGTATETWWMEE